MWKIVNGLLVWIAQDEAIAPGENGGVGGAAGAGSVTLTNDALDALVSKAVKTAMKGLSPAVHTKSDDLDKDRVDDEIGEQVGKERMEFRREAERRDALDRPQRGFQGYGVGFETPSSVSRSDGAGLRPRGGVGMLAAEFIGWLGAARGDPEKALKFARARGASKTIQKALSESTFSSGGALVPENVAADYIELLYAASVYLAANPQRITVTNGNLVLPRMVSGATVGWIGESINSPYSEPTFGQTRIDLKKLAVLTASSNEFLRDSGASAIEMIRNDLAAAAGIAIDAAALRSLGTSYTPRGLRGWVPAANQFAATGTSVAAVTADVLRGFRILEDNRIMAQRLAVFTSPRTKFGLMALRDGNNNEVFAAEMRQGSWYGARFFSTQNIPTNVGTGGNKSEIYIVDMAHQIFAEEAQGLTIDVRDGAAYFDGVSVVSGFSRDETAIRLTQRVDIVSRQGGQEIVQIFDVATA